MEGEVNKVYLLLDQLQKAQQLLSETIGTELVPKIGRVAVIKAFELCYELSWKLMKVVLEDKFDVATTSPREAILNAGNKDIIEDPEGWIEVRDKRNKMSHTYDMIYAEEVEMFVRNQFPEMLQALISNIENIYE